MAREFGRPERIADFLKKEVSQLIQMEMRDPRVGMVSVTDVEVSRDLYHARIFVTILGCDDAEQAKESVEVLNKASGFLRSQIAKNASMRVVPAMKFFFDESIGRGQYLSALIDEAVQSDSHEDTDDE